MTDIINAIILGVIEGLTEFIPVSSTGHLILVGEWLKFSAADTATFDIAIQLGAILAVVVLYWSFFKQYVSCKTWFNYDMKVILVAILPACIVGFLLHGIIKAYLFSSKTVIWALFIGGIIMGVVDWFYMKKPEKKNLKVSDISLKQALIIGICQCAALWPGMSRSGSTIVGGLLSGLSYKTAATFSFIIAVPVMIAAVSYDLLKSFMILTIVDIQLISIGFLVSFIVAYAAIKTFLKILVKYKLLPFAIYRIIKL